MAILKNYDNLSDNEKAVIDNLKTSLVDVSPSIVVMLISNTIMLSRLTNILELRADIRKHDKKYIAGELSRDAWISAEKEYDPMQELFSMFGDPLSGKSNGKDK